MRVWIPGGAVLLALGLPHPALAEGKLDRWADRYELCGAWRAKDADRDGVKNRQEYMLRTNPRRADTDRDGLRDGDEGKVESNPLKADSDGDGTRDGDENAGVITAYDARIKPGALVSSIELEPSDGDLVATEINLAPGG